ncbi:38307_t:CDS:2, partial [Gigaspora margarita]
PVPDDGKKKETIKIDTDKIKVTEDEKKEEFTIKVTNGPKDCKIDASIKVKSGKGTISGDSKQTIKADDDSVSFKVVVKDGDKATFTITLEDKDAKIKVSETIKIDKDKITVTEDKKKKEEFTIKVPFKVTNGPKD